MRVNGNIIFTVILLHKGFSRRSSVTLVLFAGDLKQSRYMQVSFSKFRFCSMSVVTSNREFSQEYREEEALLLACNHKSSDEIKTKTNPSSSPSQKKKDFHKTIIKFLVKV